MKKYFFIFIVAFFASCSPVEQDVIITIDTETVLNDCYIGNGAQWDPYQLDYGKGKFRKPIGRNCMTDLILCVRSLFVS